MDMYHATLTACIRPSSLGKTPKSYPKSLSSERHGVGKRVMFWRSLVEEKCMSGARVRQAQKVRRHFCPGMNKEKTRLFEKLHPFTDVRSSRGERIRTSDLLNPMRVIFARSTKLYFAIAPCKNKAERIVGEVALGELRAFHLVDWGTTWHRIQAAALIGRGGGATLLPMKS